MPLRIVTILGRLKQDLAHELAPDAIEQACKQEKYSWRKRMLDPVTTVYLFILQILHGNTACSHVVHFGRWNFTDAASCAARQRLPLAVLRRLVRSVACQAAKAQGVAADRVSVTDTVRWLVGVEGDQDLSVIWTLPKRGKGRVEPRVKERRPKQYDLMTKPRRELRKALLEKKVAA